MTHDLAAVEVLVVGASPHPGPEAAAVAREIAARLPQGRPGRVVLLSHTPDGPGGGHDGSSRLEEPYPVPAHRAGPLLLDWARRGIAWSETRADLAALRARLAATDGAPALRRQGVVTRVGRCEFLSRGRVAIEVYGPGGGTVVVTPHRIVLAPGAVPAVPDLPGIFDCTFLTSRSLLDLPEVPASLVVLGGGSLGCEIAQGFARLGAGVSLVESAEQLLPGADVDASREVERALREDGVRLVLGARAVKVAPTLDGGAWLGTDGGGDVAGEALVVAAGRRPHPRLYTSLGLDVAGIRTGGGRLVVDDRLRTTNPDVLALGEVTGLPGYAAAPGPMARVAAVNSLGRKTAMRWAAPVPMRVARTDPEAVQIGDPTDALQDGCGTGRADGPGPGAFVRIVVGPPSGRGLLGLGGPSARTVLSATLVGAGAADAAAQIVLAVNAGLPAATLIDTTATDGTWAAAVQVAVAQALAATADGGTAAG